MSPSRLHCPRAGRGPFQIETKGQSSAPHSPWTARWLPSRSVFGECVMGFAPAIAGTWTRYQPPRSAELSFSPLEAITPWYQCAESFRVRFCV